ncbi:hypothetical protein [Chachezhania antarctica]|uniref:hypothetical protein n=1 Tax=Chachezhania antarctica TaxID=2340860 RepID=UPI000EB33F6F|nr:hypothetical protein [Chachezhania antarctica]
MTAHKFSGSAARAVTSPGTTLPTATPPVQRNIAELAADGVSVFDRLSGSLGRVRELHMHTASDLAAFVDLSLQGESTGTEPLMELHTRLQGMQAAVEGRDRSTTPAQERELMLRAEKPLRLLSNHGRLLAAVCTMTRTISASFAIGELDAYVSSLDRIAQTITGASAEVSENIANWKLRDLAAQESCRAAGAILAPLCLSLERKAENLALHAVHEREAARQAQKRAQTLTRHAQEQMKDLITGIQFSDRLTQRLDHLAQMPTGADPHIAVLAGEHARSIADDTIQISRRIAATMRDLSEIGRKGANFFTRGVVTEQIERGLNERARTVEQVDSDILDVQGMLISAGKEAQAAREQIDEAARKFQSLEDGSKELATAAINASLIAVRAGGTRGPLTTLSTEVRQIAAQCLDAEAISRSALHTLIGSNLQAQEDIVAAGVALEFSVDQYREKLSTSQTNLANLDAFRKQAGQRAELLVDLMTTVTDDMAALRSAAEAMKSLGDSLAQTKAAGAPDQALLAQAWARYSMEEERAVHRKLFGSDGLETAQAPAPVVAPASDDIDDILF